MNNPNAHTIEIEITPEGQIKSTVKGVSGPDCGRLTKWLEELGSVTKDEHTLDFYAQQAVITNQVKAK